MEIMAWLHVKISPKDMIFLAQSLPEDWHFTESDGTIVIARDSNSYTMRSED